MASLSLIASVPVASLRTSSLTASSSNSFQVKKVSVAVPRLVVRASKDPDANLSGGGSLLRETFDLSKGPKTVEGNVSQSALETKEEVAGAADKVKEAASDAGEIVADKFEELKEGAQKVAEDIKNKVTGKE